MEKKGSNTIPFFVRVIKNITEFIAAGDSKSLLSTLLSLLYYLYSIISTLFLLRKKINQIKHRLRRLLHILHRNPFLLTMKGMFASEDIRAR